MTPEQKNQKLLNQCLRGKRQAQYQFYEQYKVLLYGICMRYAKSKLEAEDMLQEAFFKIFRDLKQFSGDVPITAWMRKITVNTALMHIRKYRKLQFDELENDIVEAFPNQLENTVISDRATVIIQMIQKLSTTQQTVFNLKTMDGFSFVEMSEILQCKEATLRSHYLRARKALQLMLNQELYNDGR